MKRFTKGVITTAALALLLTGCGKKKDSEEVTIKYWNFPNFTNDQEFPDSADYDAALIKAFEEKNPTIKVDYQKIDFTDGPAKVETAIQSKTNPDVIYDAPGRVIDWASKGYLKEFADVDTKQLDASAVKASSLDNKLYLYPQGIAPFLMAVNTNVTDKLGITDLLPLDKEDNPGRNWTVDEFETFLKAVKEKDPEMIPT
ncbi:ABC transporter substrate-binding protein [Erysipelothrix rhusiopathiae]|nr:extracellular solute-binding protein [Erysipelothrix rhusiopathiae]QDE03069.1 sugar ABC transporter substrate-binding protein [Erysipelothrix rhusiopathiae]